VEPWGNAGESLGSGHTRPQVRVSIALPNRPERHSDTEEVTGSNPVRPTTFEYMFTLGSHSGGSLWQLSSPASDPAARSIGLYELPDSPLLIMTIRSQHRMLGRDTQMMGV
jgi:hypothetical protein